MGKWVASMNLKKYFLQEKKMNLIVFFFVIMAILMSTIVQYVLTKLSDSLIGFQRSSFFYWFVVGIALTVINLFFSIYGDYLEESAKQKMDVHLRDDLARGIANESADNFNAKGSVGRYTSWLTNDVEQINDKGFQTVYNFVMYFSGIIFPISAFMMFHWTLAVTAVALGIILAFMPRVVKRLITDRSKILTTTNEQFVSRVENLLNGFETLISFGRRFEIIHRVNRSSKELKDATLGYKRSEITVDTIVSLLSVVSQEIIILEAGLLILNHQISPGVLLSVGALAGTVFTSMGQLSGLIVKIKAVDPVFAKYKDLDLTDIANVDRRPAATSQTVSLDLAAVTSASGQQVWLHPTSKQVPAGAKIRISGASGQGKSTLLRIIAGLTEHFSGQVAWQADGVTTTVTPPDLIYVPQKPFILNDSVRFNLTLGREFSQQELRAALASVGLNETIDQLPDQLDTILTANGSDLSGGQRQRIALARAILLKPVVLLLDESTANVDEHTAQAIEAQLLSDPQQLVLLVSHHPFTENKPLFTGEIAL